MITRIFDLDFYNQSFNRFIALLESRIEKQEKTFVVTANPEIVVNSSRDFRYNRSLKKANFVVPDGTGIILAARLLGLSLKEKITGIDLMGALLKKADARGYRVYFFGANQQSLMKMVNRIHLDYPGITICGFHEGFEYVDEEVVEDIKKKKADIVFVALGAPTQELWIADWLESFQKGIFVGVGGSFDVLSGMVSRAPSFLRKCHLEWLYRLYIQPEKRKKRLYHLFSFIKLFIRGLRRENSSIKIKRFE
jgi:N-acetylglucosaminyldiphosphoundecaprenol N-acetyl-beta-D-mannosaminyltransferase